MPRTYEEKLRDAKLAAAIIPSPNERRDPNYDSDHVEELNTNRSVSVKELKEFLDKCPPNARAWAYEGEGGSWICVGWKTSD